MTTVIIQTLYRSASTSLLVTWETACPSRGPLVNECAPVALLRALPPLLDRAHVRAHPRPTWGLRRRRCSRRLQPTPSKDSAPNPGSKLIRVPSSSCLLPLQSPALTTCPERLLTFLVAPTAAGHSGKCRRRGRSPPPPQYLLGWPPQPQEAQQRRRGASRWVPASRSCHFPQHQRLLPVPSFLLLAGTGGRRRLLARSLHRLLASAAGAAPAGPGPPRSAPAVRLYPQARVGLLKAGPSPSRAIVLTWSYPWRKGVPVSLLLEIRFICPLWPLERAVHPSSLSSLRLGKHLHIYILYVLLPTSLQQHSPAPSLTPLAFRLFLQYAGSVHFRTLRLLFPLLEHFLQISF